MSDIYQKLANIQQAIKVPKDQDNTFANFKYRNVEDILAQLKPLLITQKASVVLYDGIEEHAGQVYIKATARIQDLEAKGYIEVFAYAREEKERPKMSEGQLTGAASSYARKYALNGLLLLDDNKDPDSHDNTKPKPTTDGLAVAKNNLQKLLKANGHDNDVKMKMKINQVLGKNTVDTVDEANQVIDDLESE